MKVIRKKIVETNGQCKVTKMTSVGHQSYLNACKYMHELYKTDKSLYKVYVTKHMNSIKFCNDSYEYGYSYSFIVDNVCIETSIEGVEEKAEKLFGK